MQTINFKLPFATLIPDFIYQFFYTEYVDKNNLTCFELEDLRELILKNRMEGLDEIKKFLLIDLQDQDMEEQNKIILNDEEAQIDYELLEVEDEYYHKYTAGELRFIFDEIIKNIDYLYSEFYNYFGLNMTYAIGFKTNENTEMNMVIEFLSTGSEPDFVKEAFYISIENNRVSDDIMTFIYFVGNNKEIDEKILKNIVNLLEFR